MPISTRYTLNETVGDPCDWNFTWEVRDDVQLQSVCDFCGQDHQRLTYEVTREQHALWVCQRCVGRYPIGGSIDGEKLDLRSVRDQIHGLTARLKQRTCHEIIRQVQALSDDPALEESLVYFDRNLQLSPQRAATLFAEMPKLAEPVDIRIFEVQTRSNAHQEEFGAMTLEARAAVWPALSPQQRRRLTSLGHAPEPTSTRRRGHRLELRIELTGSRMSALTPPTKVDRAIRNIV